MSQHTITQDITIYFENAEHGTEWFPKIEAESLLIILRKQASQARGRLETLNEYIAAVEKTIK